MELYVILSKIKAHFTVMQDMEDEKEIVAARKAATASKEASLKFLIDAGILDKNGNWASHLR